MFTPARLRSCFDGLVGFLQPSDPNYALIDGDLTASSSGRYVQHVHPLCTLENIYNTVPEFDKFNYPAWVAGNYSASSIVTHAGVKYKASADAVAADVPGVAALWVAIDPFSEFLRETYRGAVLELARDFITAKKLEGTQKSLVDTLKLYDGLGYLNDRIIKLGRFVGFEITVNIQDGLQVIINQVGLQTDAIQGAINFYLYHTSVKAPLAVIPVNYAVSDTFAWKTVTTAILKFYEDTHDTQGAFIFGYYENDLIGQAIRKQMRWDAPCSSCNGYDAAAYSKWSKFTTLRPVYFSAPYLDGTNLPNLSGIQYTNDTNWGLNFAISVYCDLTEFFCNNKALAAEALAMKVALKFLDIMANTTRIGAIADKARGLALPDLDPKPGSGSFVDKYNDALKALSLDFSGLSSACMPFNYTRGITRGAI